VPRSTTSLVPDERSILVAWRRFVQKQNALEPTDAAKRGDAREILGTSWGRPGVEESQLHLREPGAGPRRARAK
jgi:hypothetical protein